MPFSEITVFFYNRRWQTHFWRFKKWLHLHSRPRLLAQLLLLYSTPDPCQRLDIVHVCNNLDFGFLATIYKIPWNQRSELTWKFWASMPSRNLTHVLPYGPSLLNIFHSGQVDRDMVCNKLIIRTSNKGIVIWLVTDWLLKGIEIWLVTNWLPPL